MNKKMSEIVQIFTNIFKEYLLYIRLKDDFTNPLFKSNTDIYVNEDLYKIIKSDVFINFVYKTIDNFSNVLLIQEPSLVLMYMETVKEKYIKQTYINTNLLIYLLAVIDDIILKLKNEIMTNNFPPIVNNFVIYGSYYIVPYQDLLLFKGPFNWAGFNFNEDILNVINSVNQIATTIFDEYYLNPEINVFYKTVINYTYLSTPYNYININNGIINN